MLEINSIYAMIKRTLGVFILAFLLGVVAGIVVSFLLWRY